MSMYRINREHSSEDDIALVKLSGRSEAETIVSQDRARARVWLLEG
jgi:hypothetical protein